MKATLINYDTDESEVVFEDNRVYLYRCDCNGWSVRFAHMSRRETADTDCLMARLDFQWDGNGVDGTYTLQTALRMAREILGELT